MERPRGDEQDEARVDVAMPGGDARPLDHRQQVALHPLRARVRGSALPGIANLPKRKGRVTTKYLGTRYCFNLRNRKA